MLLKFQHIFASLPRCFAGTLLLPICLFLRPVLKLWSVGAALMRFTWANVTERGILVSNFSVTWTIAFVNFTRWIGSACLSSSVKSMKTPAALCPERRNPIFVYPMICTQQVRDLTRDKCHSRQRVDPLHQATHDFFNMVHSLLSSFFLDLLLRCANEHFSQICNHSWSC